jgi:microcystin-dependent protein
MVTIASGNSNRNTADAGAHGHTLTVDGNTATNNAATATNQNTGGGGAHNNLQPYIVLNYIIKV